MTLPFMAQKLRFQYSGTIYYFMNRGNHHEVIFLDEVDSQCFHDLLFKACEKIR
jgi:hypothetical protein